MDIKKIFFEHKELVNHILESNFLEEVKKLGNICIKALKDDKKIIFMGNGGSAADCQHLAAEIIGKFFKKRKALPAIALTTDTSILTSIGNDFGFEDIFTRQIEALANSGDVVIGISTSGNSINIIKGILVAKEKKAITVCFSGKSGGKLGKICDLTIQVPSDNTARIQEMHILIGHIICEMIDEAF